jgi:putative DNA primase/helicase
LRENPISFSPSHKLFIDCNHAPAISDPNDAVWNRIKVIPFPVKLTDAEKDPDLRVKLRSEHDGILAWLVEGARRYYADGLGDLPSMARDATGAYRAKSDPLREFFQEECVFEPNAIVSVKMLYERYKAWAESAGGDTALNKATFKRRLEQLNCQQDFGRDHVGKRTRIWMGVRFRKLEDDPVAEETDFVWTDEDEMAATLA